MDAKGLESYAKRNGYAGAVALLEAYIEGRSSIYTNFAVRVFLNGMNAEVAQEIIFDSRI